MTLFDMSAAILMLLLATAFLAWFFSWKAAGSLRRRNAMMAKLGVDPTSLKFSAVMNDVGKRSGECCDDRPQEHEAGSDGCDQPRREAGGEDPVPDPSQSLTERKIRDGPL